MAKKKAAKKAAKKVAPVKKKAAAKKSTSTAPKVKKSTKATQSLAPMLAPPPEQAKMAPASKRSLKQETLVNTHGMAIQGHIAGRGRAKQAARDVRNAPRKRGE